jgi:hypothetical protein
MIYLLLKPYQLEMLMLLSSLTRANIMCKGYSRFFYWRKSHQWHCSLYSCSIWSRKFLTTAGSTFKSATRNRGSENFDTCTSHQQTRKVRCLQLYTSLQTTLSPFSLSKFINDECSRGFEILPHHCRCFPDLCPQHSHIEVNSWKQEENSIRVLVKFAIHILQTEEMSSTHTQTSLTIF